MNFQQEFFEIIGNVVRYLRGQPLNLGGYTASGGGGGGPPGGFIGYLPQTRVAYDITELASSAIPTSGASLLDNLNHIRYRLDYVEGSGSSGMIIKSDDVIIASGIHYLDFQNNFTVVAESIDEVSVSLMTSGVQSDVTYSGVYGENLTGSITGLTTHFDIAGTVNDASLAVYFNGIRQSDSNYTLDEDCQGFTLAFTPISGDSLTVDYIEAYDGYFHTHSQYALASGVLSIEALLELLEGYSQDGHTHVEADITDLDHDATSIMGTPVASGIGPTDNQVLMFTTTSGEYTPSSIPVNQQIVFTIASSGSFIVGTKPLRVYVHDVGDYADISEIFVCVNTAPATDMQMNVLKNGTTIFDAPAYITLPSGSYTASKTTGFLDTSLEKDDYLQIAVVDGDNTASDMTLHIRYTYYI